MSFQVGQKIKFVSSGPCCSARPGEIYTIIPDGRTGQIGVGDNSQNLCSCQERWQLVKNSNVVDKLGLSSLTALGILGLLGYAVFKKESKQNGK
jgi:hypothetical protein